MTAWPTGWHGPLFGGSNYLAFPEIRDDTGYDDTHSLWFRNTDSVTTPLCYSGTDFSAAPSVQCRDERFVNLYQTLNVARKTVNTGNPQQFRVGFWYRADNVSQGASHQSPLAGP